MKAYSILWLGVLLILTSCGPDDPDICDIQDYIDSSTLAFEQTSSGLYYSIQRSTGSELIREDEFVRFDFRQSNLDRIEVANSYESGVPIAIEINQLLDGLREGLQLMGPGDMATFLVPANLSSGVTTQGGIVYEIELLEVYESVIDFNDVLITAYLESNNIMADRTEEGVYVSIEEEGNENTPLSSSSLTVHYRGYLLNGDVFDSSFDRGTPNTFTLSGLIEGWQIGLTSFGEGGKGMIFIPSYLGYGSAGNASIPPNTPLIFDIELINVD